MSKINNEYSVGHAKQAGQLGEGIGDRGVSEMS